MVTPSKGSLSQDTGAVTTAKAQMADIVDQLRAKIKVVTQAVDAAEHGWSGSAFTACQTAANAWDQKAVKLNAILDAVTRLVGSSTHTYTGLEHDNKSQFDKLVNTGAPAAATAYTNLHPSSN